MASIATTDYAYPTCALKVEHYHINTVFECNIQFWIATIQFIC